MSPNYPEQSTEHYGEPPPDLRIPLTYKIIDFPQNPAVYETLV